MTKPQLNFVAPTDECLENHEDAVSHYYSIWAQPLSNAAWYNDEKVFAWLDQIVALRPRRVLEICCGSGYVVERLAAPLSNTTFHAVDISPGMCERAVHRCRQLPNVQIFEGDWLAPIRGGEPYDVILIKNSLHLIRNLHDRLRELRRVSHSKTRLVIVETISPSSASRTFVQRLFRIVDQHHLKTHYFIKMRLMKILREADWVPSRDAKRIDQLISVDKWLSFKVASHGIRKLALDLVCRAPRQIRDEMNISVNKQGVFMLRRQILLFAFPRS